MPESPSRLSLAMSSSAGSGQTTPKATPRIAALNSCTEREKHAGSGRGYAGLAYRFLCASSNPPVGSSIT